MLVILCLALMWQEEMNISVLKQKAPSQGEFLLRGYVSKIYTCPPCPPGVTCKPCVGDNIVLSEKKRVLDSYKLQEGDLVIFVKKPSEFRLGKRYLCKVKVLSSRTTSSEMNDLELISSKTLE